jgi:hypothetical protein
MSYSSDWDVESVFIEKVLNALPFDFNLESLLNVRIGYETWKQTCDKVLLEFITDAYVYFEVCMERKKIIVPAEEITALKKKLQCDEIAIIRRAYHIALNEAIHNDDEVWDSR